MMKSFLFTIAVIALLSLSIGCKKCTVCTSANEDPAATVAVDTAEFCGRGRSYQEQLDQYNKSKWYCTDKK